MIGHSALGKASHIPHHCRKEPQYAQYLIKAQEQKYSGQGGHSSRRYFKTSGLIQGIYHSHSAKYWCTALP